MIVFGEAPTGETRERLGSYGVVVDERWRVAVVRVGTVLYLPGGGAEPGETPEDTLRREVREETGLEVEVVSIAGHANDWCKTGSRVLRVATYFVCRPTGTGVATEPDHELVWMRGSEALGALRLPSDRWVLRRALGPC